MSILQRSLLPIAALTLVAPGLATHAQEQASSGDEIEEIVVSGLRGDPRSAVDSAVPIDTFDQNAIEAVSHTDTVEILQTLIPSYSVSREPISDGSSFIRPAQLRGLPSHHTLVLVNGKRRHRAALVVTGGSGTQGPDVATIPAVGIQSIEVLRDGASSQYGSDAIAGVINFNLKDNRDGFTIQGETGQFFEGDGTTYEIAGNVGLPLGDSGFLSISAEYNDNEFTERSEQYCETWFCVDPNNARFSETGQLEQDYVTGTPTPGADPYVQGLQQAFPAGIPNASLQGETVQPWGQPNLDAFRMFYNAGYDLANGAEIYSFGNYSDSTGDGSFFYRYPGNGTIELLRRPNGALWSPLEFFPGGFTPRFEGNVEDMSFVAGFRNTTEGGFSYDISARYGSNEIDYTLMNTFNPSYGFASPTAFNPGTLTNEELQFQVDLINDIDIGTASPLVLAYGVSYMDETYDVGQSNDVASYDDGPYALEDPFGFCNNGAPTTVAGGGEFTDWGGETAVAGVDVPGLDCSGDDPAFTVVGVGSNGFPGYSPAFSGEYTRDSYAIYGDVSTDVTDNLFLQAAIRYEDYSDFGDELVGKIAGRVLLGDIFALRASIGTGFRAPTPGQQGTTNVATLLPNGFPVATGLFPASGPVAQALGATPLDAETSTSYTFGATADFENLTLTIDFYQIDIDDRFNAISTLDVSVDPASGDAYDNYLALLNAGVVGAESIGGVRYFTNAFDSETRGVDLVASYLFDWGNGQDTNVQLALNWNENEIVSNADAFLNAEEQFDFENADPKLRWNLTATHGIGDLSILGRVRYFGEFENSDNTTPLSIQEYDATFFVDLEANWQLNDNWRLTVGGRNIFDEFVDEVDRIASDNDFCCGRVYPSSTIVPWQGGYYYGRVSLNF